MDIILTISCTRSFAPISCFLVMSSSGAPLLNYDVCDSLYPNFKGICAPDLVVERSFLSGEKLSICVVMIFTGHKYISWLHHLKHSGIYKNIFFNCIQITFLFWLLFKNKKVKLRRPPQRSSRIHGLLLEGSTVCALFKTEAGNEMSCAVINCWIVSFFFVNVNFAVDHPTERKKNNFA